MLTWHYLTRFSYDIMPISEKTSDKLFFIKDTKEIYCGMDRFKESIVLYTIEPANPTTGKLYVNRNTLEGKIWSGSKWVTAIYPIKDTRDNEYIDVKSVIYNPDHNNLKVIMMDDSEDTIEFNNLLLDLLYSDGKFMIEYDSCHLSNSNKCIYIDSFITDISYTHGNIVIDLNDSESIYIDAGTIIKNSTYDITAITITGNSFIAESIAASDDNNNTIVYKNKIYAVKNSSKANYSPISTYSTNDSNTKVISSDDATNYAVMDISTTLQSSLEDKMNKVAPGFEGEILIADTDGDAKLSGVKICTNNIRNDPNHTLVPTEKAVITYIETNVVTKDDVSTSTNMPTSKEYASDDRVVSEKGLLSTMGWHIL